MTTGKQAFGLQVKMRTSLGVDAVKASSTHGTSNQQIVITAKQAGAAGNAISISFVNPGANGNLSIGVSGNAITVTLGYASSAINSTVNDVIAKIYQTPAAAALVDASPGAGNGSGLMTALSSSNLTSGADGTHVYSLIKGVQDARIPGLGRESLEATSHSSPNGDAEYIKSIVKAGREFTLPILFDPTDATHLLLKAAESSNDVDNFEFVFPFAGSNFRTDALVLDFDMGAPVKGLIDSSVRMMFTGSPVSV